MFNHFTQRPIQRVPGALSPGVKLPGLEADHSPPPNADFKNDGALPPFHQMLARHSALLIKHRDSFTFLPCLSIYN
jgi:hypothetical protein